MSNLKRRGLIFLWLTLGVFPMTLLWRYMWPALVFTGADTGIAQFISGLVAYLAFCFVFWAITEIPKSEGKS